MIEIKFQIRVVAVNSLYRVKADSDTITIKSDPITIDQWFCYLFILRLSGLFPDIILINTVWTPVALYFGTLYLLVS
jgi:hypothetical protein